MDKKTPLFDIHEKLGGKIVPFGGYLLPVQYATGVITEHMAVRTRAGLFDVSHMGELMLEGPDAVANIQKICTTDISLMTDGQVKYAMMCNENGGIVDDLAIYRMKEDKYMLVVNAGNHDKDAAWVEEHLSGDVKYETFPNPWHRLHCRDRKRKIFSESSATKNISPPNTITSLKTVWQIRVHRK